MFGMGLVQSLSTEICEKSRRFFQICTGARVYAREVPRLIPGGKLVGSDLRTCHRFWSDYRACRSHIARPETPMLVHPLVIGFLASGHLKLCMSKPMPERRIAPVAT